MWFWSRTKNQQYFCKKNVTFYKNKQFFPKIIRIAEAYQIDYRHISKIENLQHQIKSILKIDAPMICEIECQEIQEIYPGITASKDKDGKLVQNDFSKMTPF